jgi:archaellum component FlaD/FlaE
MSSGNLNSHLHVSTATTLPTETSLCTPPEEEFSFMLYVAWFEFILEQVCVLV